MKIKRVITIPDEIIVEMEKFPHRASKIVKNRDCTIADAILNSKPYDDSGDLISREALKTELNSRPFPQDYSTTLLLGTFNDLIDNAPPVETFTLEDMQNNYDAGVDSVIGKYDKAKGYWSQYSFHDLGAFGDWDYKCSKCNKVNGWKANFCPNCGADMRGGDKE